MWRLARRQHGVVSRAQLLELGLTRHGIAHRLDCGRLHRLHRGVFAVGRPEVDRPGELMAAVLACGPAAVLSHQSAAELWGLRTRLTGPIDVSLVDGSARRVPGVRIHRRRVLERRHISSRLGIPVTSPARTIVDLAPRLGKRHLEAAVNEADRRDLIDPESLRDALDVIKGQPGTALLRRLLDRRTFALTDSELERRFLRVARSAGLPVPETGRQVNGFRVDFFWPGLGLVVETDGLRYHRTPAQQARDRRRDQRHAAAGLTTLRFTHAQVRFEAPYVRRILSEVARRLIARA